MDKENVAADVLEDATRVPYNASCEVAANPRLYHIDAGEYAQRARAIEADKEAERQKKRDELAALIAEAMEG